VQAQVLWMDMRSLVWLTDQLFHSHQFPCVLVSIPVGSCIVLPVSPGIGGSPRLIGNLSGSCQGPWWLPDCQKEYRCSLCSPFLFSIIVSSVAIFSIAHLHDHSLHSEVLLFLWLVFNPWSSFYNWPFSAECQV
jgi:hypothetical protein